MILLANPWLLALAVLIPPVVYFALRTDKKRSGSLRFSNKEMFDGIKPTLRVLLSRKLIYVRALGVFLLILAAARPQSATEETKIYIEGIDIVLAVDTSTSMRAMDFEMAGKRVDRLAVVKNVVTDFIEKRPNDKIGMVAFAALAYTICPLTLDHDWLELNLERVNIGMIEDGTAIGTAITAALNRLKDTEAEEKVIILLTDGRNNAGRVTPMIAAEAAKALGVRIYTIGAGTKGLAPYPVKDMFGNTVLRPIEVDIDEDLLKKIADVTDGEYFRATDTRSLKRIYDRIDELETTPIEETGYNIYKELFFYALFPGLFLLLAELMLANTVLRRLP